MNETPAATDANKVAAGVARTAKARLEYAESAAVAQEVKDLADRKAIQAALGGVGQYVELVRKNFAGYLQGFGRLPSSSLKRR